MIPSKPLAAAAQATQPGPRPSPASTRRAAFRPARWVGALVVVFAAAALGWWGWSSYRASVLLDEAQAAARRARWDKAEAALAARAWYRPNDPDALGLRATVALRRGDKATALAYLARVPDTVPDAARRRLTRGLLLKELYRVGEAEEEFRASLQLDPAQIEPRRELLTILGVERRTQEQETALWSMFDKTEARLEALRILAQAQPIIPPGALNQTADEGSVLEHCLRAEPGNRHLRQPLAYFLRNRGQVNEAKQLLIDQLARFPDDSEAVVEYAACLLDEGNAAEAQAWFERPIRARTGRWWQLRGACLEMQGQRDEAIASLEEAVRVAPRDPEAHYRLGQALHEAGRTRDSERLLQWHRGAQELRALAASVPDERPDPATLLRAGRLCRNMERLREAQAWYAEALRCDPNLAEARAALDAMAHGHAESASTANTTRAP